MVSTALAGLGILLSFLSAFPTRSPLGLLSCFDRFWIEGHRNLIPMFITVSFLLSVRPRRLPLRSTQLPALTLVSCVSGKRARFAVDAAETDVMRRHIGIIDFWIPREALLVS